MGREKRIIVIERKRILHFRSIRECERMLGLSHQKIIRALNSEDGVIRGTYPPICIDEELDIGEQDNEFG